MINTRKIIYRKNEVTSHFFFFRLVLWFTFTRRVRALLGYERTQKRRNENRFRRVFARSRLSPTVAALKLKRILGRLFFSSPQTATARAGGSFYYARERTSIELRRKCVYGKPRAERRARYATAMCYVCMVCGIEQTIDINNKQKICV